MFGRLSERQRSASHREEGRKGGVFVLCECYLLQAAYIGSYRAQTKGGEREKTRSDRGYVYNEKGVARRSGMYFRDV